MKLTEKIERTKVSLVYWLIATASLLQMALTYPGLIIAAAIAGALMLREEWVLEHLEAKRRKRPEVT
jgi:hypothetical protein